MIELNNLVKAIADVQNHPSPVAWRVLEGQLAIVAKLVDQICYDCGQQKRKVTEWDDKNNPHWIGKCGCPDRRWVMQGAVITKAEKKSASVSDEP